MVLSRTFLVMSLVPMVAALSATTTASEFQPTTRTIYASVTDESGQPVPDLTQSDFVVKEGNIVQRISVRKATAPLRVALIVSDGGHGSFQTAAVRFCEAILDHGEIGITGEIVDFETFTTYTNSVDALRAALLRLGKVGFITRPTSRRLIENIVSVAKDIRRDGYRTAIVVLGGHAARPAFHNNVALDAIRRSGAVTYVVSPDPAISISLATTAVVTLLQDAAKQSGGRFVEFRTEVPVLQVASELINRYEITYGLPAGASPNESISVSVLRAGVTVHAPSRLAK